MKIREGASDKWSELRQKNGDDYGKACVDYSEAWADEMERRMALGEKIEDIADETSHEIDRRPEFGITGFMYGCAVEMLSHCWEHGEALRRWHNAQMDPEKKTGANDSGGVINPAIFAVKDT